MAKTGYTINQGIQQVFTSGPAGIINSLVTSSYSNGSTTFGPTINFKQSFVSGTVETLYPCDIAYDRYYLDPINCPISGCPQPILNSVVANCNPYNYTYSVSYNFISSSGFVPSSSIEFSTNSTFSTNTGSVTYDNTAATQLPVDVSGLPLLPLSTTLVYFRVLNRCVGSTISSYSNVISASCIPPPTSSQSTVTTTSTTSTFPGTEQIFRVNGASGSIVNYSTGQIDSGSNGGYIEMFDEFGAQYSIDAYAPRSGTITIPSIGQISLTINYVANTNIGTNTTNRISQVITFKDSSNTTILSPNGSMFIGDEYNDFSAQ